MNIGVVVFPGSNCDHDCQHVFRDVLGQDVTMVWHKETSLVGLDGVILPGGFSYGDYLRTGAIARFSPVMNAVKEFATGGGLVLGICNGFQILCETQMLPGILLRNSSLKFVCRRVTLRVENADSDFTRAYKKGQEIRVIVAHGDGNYFASNDTLKELEDDNRVAFRYCDNPNGSIRDIAGIFNKKRNVLGLMPHPEDAVEPMHGSTDGAGLFESLLRAVA